MIKAVIYVSAPRPAVFSVLTNYPQYRTWLPGCEQSEVIKREGNTTDTEIVIRSMKTMRIGLRFEASQDQLLSFHMISGQDMKAYDGSYRLMDAADGDGTVVVAELEIDAGPMAPRFLVDRFAKKAIDDTGKALGSYLRESARPGVVPAARRPVKTGRPKRLVQLGKVGNEYRLWLSGRIYNLKG